MKNFIKIIFSASLAAFLTGHVLAQTANPAASDDQTTKQTTVQTQTVGKFVDKNNNGICDNRETMQNNNAKGRNFVDANGDGICDRRGEGNLGKCNPDCRRGRGNCYCRGMGYQHRPGAGNQQCRFGNR